MTYEEVTLLLRKVVHLRAVMVTAKQASGQAKSPKLGLLMQCEWLMDRCLDSAFGYRE